MSTNAPHLPNNFIIEGYRITEFLESGDNYYLYKAESPAGKTVQLREFCPKDLAFRDPETSRIRYQNPDPELINSLKKRYDAIYSINSLQEVQSHGTSFFIYDAQPAAAVAGIAPRERKARRRPTAAPAAQAPLPSRVANRKERSSAAILPVIMVAIIGVVGFLAYQLMRDDSEIKPVAITQPEPPKPPKVEPVLVPEPEPEPEPVVVVPEPEPEPEPIPEEPEGYKASRDLLAMRNDIRSKLEQNQGKITPEMRTAYIDYAEASVREYVTKQGGKFSPAFDEWVKKTNNRADVFASFYPPDPNVATNTDILVNELGERAYAYDQLLLTFAVGRRVLGLGAFDIERQSKYSLAGKHLNSIMKWQQPADLFIAGKKPINYFGPNPNQVDDEVYQKVHEYLVANKLTPKEAFLAKKKTIASLEQYGVDNGNLLSYLHEELYRNDQMKRKRDPFPTSVEFFNYLVDKYEMIGKMKDVGHKKVDWDGVPLECTPWLAMLPLSESRPIRECEAVWDRYLGKFGGARIWRYGPYRRDDDPEPPALFSLDPDPEWSLDSNDRCLHVGGVCGTMSLIARNSQIAMGSPAGPAGQPGHGNLMTYHYSGSGSRLTVDQSVDTLKNTHGDWYLRDSTAKRTSSGEYHLGLALSLNLDIQDVMDSRLNMNIYKLAYDETADTQASDSLKETILTDTVKLNPFYAEAWYTLFDQRGGDLFAAMACIDEIRDAVPTGSRANKLWERKKYHKSLGRPKQGYKETLSNDAKDFTDTINAAMLELALKSGQPDLDKKQWDKILSWMRAEAKTNGYPDVNQAYQIAVAQSKGSKNLVAEVERDFDKVLRHYKSKRTRTQPLTKVDPVDLAIKINAVVLVMPEDKALPWVTRFIEEAPDLLKFKPKPGRGSEITFFYKNVSDQYMKLADESVAQAFREDLKKQEADFVLSYHGDAPKDD